MKQSPGRPNLLHVGGDCFASLAMTMRGRLLFSRFALLRFAPQRSARSRQDMRFARSNRRSKMFCTCCLIGFSVLGFYLPRVPD